MIISALLCMLLSTHAHNVVCTLCCACVSIPCICICSFFFFTHIYTRFNPACCLLFPRTFILTYLRLFIHMYIFISTYACVVTRECTQAHACLHIMFVVLTLSRMQIVIFTHTRTCMPACICYAGPRLYLCFVINFHPLAVHTLLHQALCSGAASCRPLPPPVHDCLHQVLCSFAALCGDSPPPIAHFSSSNTVRVQDISGLCQKQLQQYCFSHCTFQYNGVAKQRSVQMLADAQGQEL